MKPQNKKHLDAYYQVKENSLGKATLYGSNCWRSRLGKITTVRRGGLLGLGVAHTQKNVWC